MDKLVNKGKMLISDSEIAILSKYDIKVTKNTSYDEVLFLIDMYLNNNFDLDEEEYNEIDYIANNLMERKYYTTTNK